MLQFTTPVKIDKYKYPISYKDQLFLVGSCFVDNIGQELMTSGFHTTINPTGTLFNPISVGNILQIGANSPISSTRFIEEDGINYSFDYPKKISGETKAELTGKIQQINSLIQEKLETTTHLIITWGTAWVYYWNEDNQVVANCHKQPAQAFYRRRLSVDEIVTLYQTLISSLLKRNPSLQITITVSPIRHTKDGLHENQLSKATLLLAADQLQQLFAGHLTYFPSYEIVMDELRDYRFYKDDLIHISSLGISHIWEKFVTAAIHCQCESFIPRYRKINQFFQHKPSDPTAENYLGLKERTLNKLKQLDQEVSKLV